ncbi:MAG: MBL fold metallo-hydrolase [Gammaproteobacteria bacterium]|nr:MBL fold metallo-hydrolase [Gammaproteobacteria bacterium]
MRLASLGSGSRGNGTLLAFENTYVLVDCGFPLKQTWARLARLGVEPQALSAILVTHEHSDHASGVVALGQRFKIPVYLSHGSLHCIRGLDDLARPFNAGDVMMINDVEVRAVAVPHDAREPTQFVFRWGRHQVGILTDIGHITPHVTSSYGACTGLFMESNHDRGMLMRGAYPERLKRRIAGDFGHLSNEQAAAFLDSVVHDALTHVVVGHVSEQNNSKDRLEHVFARFAARIPSFSYATQDDGIGWLEL